MNQKWELVAILCIVVLITSVITHGLTTWLKIETAPGGFWVAGPDSGRPSVFMAGSSLASDGISWGRIAQGVNLRIEGWGVAGSSPSEWERFQQLEAHITQTILVVSPYDLNEYFLSDHHALVVPLTQVLRDLWISPIDWSFSKRVVSDYPLRYIRVFFPSAGRSNGIIKGIREKVETSLFPANTPKDPILAFTDPVSVQEIKKVKISTWSQSLMLRRLVGMRIACQGRHSFNGLKKLAFQRMLRQAQSHGSVVVVVLPVSPAYSNDFLNPMVMREFEEALTDAQHAAPKAQWIRLDRLNKLNSNDYFYDLVHMNADGQVIATEELLAQLNTFTDLR